MELKNKIILFFVMILSLLILAGGLLGSINILSRSEEQAKSLYLSRLEKDALRIQFQMDMLKKYGQFLVQHHFVVGFLELLQRTQNTNKNNIENSILFRQLNSFAESARLACPNGRNRLVRFCLDCQQKIWLSG